MKIITIALLFAVPVLLFGCNDFKEREEASQPEAASYLKITAEQAKEMMDSGEPYILIDVRTEEEFSERHIEGAILVPQDEIILHASAELPDKNSLILVYCLRGARSEAAARALVDMGYTNVYDFGGIVDWNY